MADFRMPASQSISREEYDALEAEGLIRRPLTWGTMRRKHPTRDEAGPKVDLTTMVESFGKDGTE